MTRAEVEALLENQRKARARRESVSPLEVEGLSMSRDCGPFCDCGACVLENQRKARERRPVSFGGAACSCNPLDPCDCGARPSQLTLVKPDALPRAVELVLPLPPSWNRVFKARAVPVGRGKFTAQVYKSQEAKQYAATVGAHVRRQLEEPFPRHVMLRVSGDVVMQRAGCDLDDRFKVLLDSLQGHVFVNDEQVAEFGRVRRLVDSANPHVRLVFEPIAVDRYGKATS